VAREARKDDVRRSAKPKGEGRKAPAGERRCDAQHPVTGFAAASYLVINGRDDQQRDAKAEEADGEDLKGAARGIDLRK
jgi:hypothetical protein